jgi:uncharacterized protein (TIGR03382 family)
MRLISMLVTALFGAALAAQQSPTNAEMAFIYELNRARANPQAYAAANSLGTLLDGVAAQPPLAVNHNLVQSARFHSTEMAANSYFAHTSPVTGDQPNKMARDAGYPLPGSWPDAANYIESLAVRYSSAGSTSYPGPEALLALIIDQGVSPPGHRIHLLAMNASYASHREIGVGFAAGNAPTQSVPPPSGGGSWNSGAYWSIHTGRRNTADADWLTGVVYNDGNSNGRYDIGEGLGGVTVSTTGAGVLSTTTNSAGGWALPADAGSYTVTCAGAGFSGTATAVVNVASDNVEVDFVSGASQGEVNFGGGTPPPGGGNPPPGNSDDTETTDDGGGGCSTAPAPTRLALVIVPALAALWRRRRPVARGR